MAIFRRGTSAEPSRRPDVGQDPVANRAADQAKAAIDNVKDGHERAAPGSAGEPSWPTGGNISQGPRRTGGAR